MHPGAHSHPDRVATTLATVAAVAAERDGREIALPEPGSYDCRIDLKLLRWQAELARERSAAARERLDSFDPDRRPDLWAGTVQDGTARGFAAALEEAISLAPEALDEVLRTPEAGAKPVEVLEGKALRRRREFTIPVADLAARFTRREGLALPTNDGASLTSNCLRFEARRDLGSLDGFLGAEDERPRLFSPQFLQPRRYETAPGFARLDLAGRLGRGPIGWPLRMTLVGCETDAELLLDLEIDNGIADWRLRARFLGLPDAVIEHQCTPVREVVANDAGGFVAFTLVRSCGTLLVDGRAVPVPGARCLGTLRHRFRLSTARLAPPEA